MAESPEPETVTISRVERYNAQGHGWAVLATDHVPVVGYSRAEFIRWLEREGDGFYIIRYEDETSGLFAVNGPVVYRVTNVDNQPVLIPVQH